MDPEEDNKLDPAFASALLLEIGQEQSLEGLLQKLVARVLQFG